MKAGKSTRDRCKSSRKSGANPGGSTTNFHYYEDSDLIHQWSRPPIFHILIAVCFFPAILLSFTSLLDIEGTLGQDKKTKSHPSFYFW